MIFFWVPYYNRDPKRDHNFDNHPFGFRVCNPKRNPLKIRLL